jgi:hypothetical protein
VSTEVERKDFWQLLENAPSYAEGVADLFHWSTNYDYPTPATLFLDLIGYSDKHFGEPMFDLKHVPGRLGYLELGKLAKALDEYSDRPSDVLEYVQQLLDAESDQ